MHIHKYIRTYIHISILYNLTLLSIVGLPVLLRCDLRRFGLPEGSSNGSVCGLSTERLIEGHQICHIRSYKGDDIHTSGKNISQPYIHIQFIVCIHYTWKIVLDIFEEYLLTYIHTYIHTLLSETQQDGDSKRKGKAAIDVLGARLGTLHYHFDIYIHVYIHIHIHTYTYIRIFMVITVLTFCYEGKSGAALAQQVCVVEYCFRMYVWVYTYKHCFQYSVRIVIMIVWMLCRC